MNRGSVLSSGTIGAAMEGCLAGRRSIAISFPFFQGFHNWTDAEIGNAVKVFTQLHFREAFCFLVQGPAMQLKVHYGSLQDNFKGYRLQGPLQSTSGRRGASIRPQTYTM